MHLAWRQNCFLYFHLLQVGAILGIRNTTQLLRLLRFILRGWNCLRLTPHYKLRLLLWLSNLIRVSGVVFDFDCFHKLDTPSRNSQKLLSLRTQTDLLLLNKSLGINCWLAALTKSLGYFNVL